MGLFDELISAAGAVTNPVVGGIVMGIVKENWDSKHPGMVKVELFLSQSGMNVTGEILVSSVHNALTIPSEALLSDSEGWYVQLQSGEYRGVTLGVTTDSQVQILTGLAEGDVIVY